MAQQSTVRNPFMLMLQPEVVLAAVEHSERLGKLNRHMCRPLDRLADSKAGQPGRSVDEDELDDLVPNGEIDIQ